MFKRWASFILIVVLVLSLSTVFADAQQAPVVRNITVTEAGGKYDLGIAELKFKKDCLGANMQDINFTVSFYAENGVPYIDIEPSIDSFANEVMIKVQKGTVEMFDIATGKPVTVQLKNYNFKVEHFSRYILLD